MHPWALGPLLDEGHIIDDEETFGTARLLRHEVDQARLTLVPVPGRIGDEVLDRLILGVRDTERRGLHALPLAGEEEPEGVLEGASPPSAIAGGVAERTANANLLDVTLKSREAGALPGGQAAGHADWMIGGRSLDPRSSGTEAARIRGQAQIPPK